MKGRGRIREVWPPGERRQGGFRSPPPEPTGRLFEMRISHEFPMLSRLSFEATEGFLRLTNVWTGEES